MAPTRARDLIRDTRPVYASPETSIRKAAELMAQHNIGSIPVVDASGRLVGIFTERDLTRLVARDEDLDKPLRDTMTPNPVTAHPDDPLPLLAYKMIEHNIRHIPVVDDNGRLLGVVSIRRVLRHLIAREEWP